MDDGAVFPSDTVFKLASAPGSFGMILLVFFKRSGKLGDVNRVVRSEDSTGPQINKLPSVVVACASQTAAEDQGRSVTLFLFQWKNTTLFVQHQQ